MNGRLILAVWWMIAFMAAPGAQAGVPPVVRGFSLNAAAQLLSMTGTTLSGYYSQADYGQPALDASSKDAAGLHVALAPNDATAITPRFVAVEIVSAPSNGLYLGVGHSLIQLVQNGTSADGSKSWLAFESTVADTYSLVPLAPDSSANRLRYHQWQWFDAPINQLLTGTGLSVAQDGQRLILQIDASEISDAPFLVVVLPPVTPPLEESAGGTASVSLSVDGSVSFEDEFSRVVLGGIKTSEDSTLR